jgi:glycosyltransferase involved in cell wall biosynthesis
LGVSAVDPLIDKSMNSQPPELTVVLPFKNAASTIAEQLEALERQDFSGAWELVAVDNCSRDESRRIVESFAGRLNLRVFDAREGVGGGYASNVGARHALADKLIFVDADDVVAPGYLVAMAAALDRHDFVISAFDYETLNPAWIRAAYGGYGRDPDNPLAAHFGVLPSAGASVGVTRAVLEAVGGFPDDLPRMYDIAMSWEVQFRGTTLHYVPEAVYRVRYRATLPELFGQAFSGSSCAALLYKRYRSVGMRRRTVGEALGSWARLVVRFARARNKPDLAPLIVQFGREVGRVNGSIRYRVFFP